ncbi:metalloproteinase inhibitor 3-like [Eriocheir sinensis]|uniref:metalloproteinase inhibitor 3-like n=1 Tax=Eriocheir sinensis TaxID=95602 RepID=UPI0021C748A3|nr:metalloproteinase inhibitor 3-like [Eriocheir sinensis]XP_050700375.1 metalloproteinase inhibitor 3-like [Eriocheir sinensis]
MARVWWRVAAAVVVAVVVAPPPAAPCTCQLRHPQQHVCDAHYVVFARVRRLTKTPEGHEAYKVRVKRLLKGSEKVEAVLQKGLLYNIDGTCSAGLLNRTSYVISGFVASGKPMVSLCNFASPVRNLTPKMKKGLKLLYQSGCDCPIMSCHHYSERCPRAAFFCSWTTSRHPEDCQGRQSVCLRGPSGRCEWLQGRVYRRCMKTFRHNSTAPARPHHNSIRLGAIGIHRRKHPKFPYKRRPGLRRRFRRPRPTIGYLPKKG